MMFYCDISNDYDVIVYGDIEGYWKKSVKLMCSTMPGVMSG